MQKAKKALVFEADGFGRRAAGASRAAPTSRVKPNMFLLIVIHQSTSRTVQHFHARSRSLVRARASVAILTSSAIS